MTDLNPITPENIPTSPGFRFFPFFNRKQAAFVIALLALIFYSPSFYNEYALDDGIVIHQNAPVLKGILGMEEILGRDLYDSFYRRMNAGDQLAGGRYRPLSVLTFALEQQLIGTYRSGFYMHNEDLNRNGVLDPGLVAYNRNGTTIYNYEYNDFVDLNGDGKAQAKECYTCWDRNLNFKNDPQEDRNIDGIFNEVDCQVHGAWLRHFNNIWLYALACVLLYIVFAKYFLRGNQDLAFLAALLFAIHPVHSESVANVRGRDDIFSLIFIALTFISAFRVMEKRSAGTLLLTALMFFLALLSKEYAPLLYLLLPIALYTFHPLPLRLRELLFPFALFILTATVMIFFDLRGLTFLMPPLLIYLLISLLFAILCFIVFRNTLREKQAGALMIALYITGLFYLSLRLHAVNLLPVREDTEILNNPFVLASGAEAFATKIYTLLIYLRLSIFPHPLVSDYSYNTIAYRQLSDPGFLFSLLLHLSLLVSGIVLLLRRHVLGFAFLTYLGFLLSVGNLILPTGNMMMESQLFLASIGTVIVLAWGLLWLFNKMGNTTFNARRGVFLSLLAIITLLSGIKTWERCRDWKNDVTLFLKDVKKAPNSVLVLGNAGARWIDLSDTREITGISMPGQDTTVFNDYNGTLQISDEEMKAGGFATKREAALHKGISYLEHAVELHPRYVNGFLNLGLAYFKLGMEEKAIYNWKYAEYLYPNNPYLSNYYYVFSGILRERGKKAMAENDLPLALRSYKKWTIIMPDDADAWFYLGNVYSKMNNSNAALKAWRKAKELNPVLMEMYPGMKKETGDGC